MNLALELDIQWKVKFALKAKKISVQIPFMQAFFC